MEPESDWRDGFLFLGNQLSLDFLNTRPEVDGQPVELLPDAGALLRWLTAAELLSKRKAGEMGKTWAPGNAEGQMRGLHEFREAYRKIILEREAGRSLTPGSLSYLNGLLREHCFTDQVIRDDSGVLKRRRLFEPRRPLDALGPIVDAAVQLLVEGDPARIRKCDRCVLHFADTSKKGTRRWCSMEICGNRAKVAAYARRQRG